MNWARVWEGLPRGARFFAAFFPPDFISRWSEISDGILESLWMTVVATVIGIVISVPVGIGAAKNIAPGPIYYFCRGILTVSRSFQEIILAIFFVKLFGFGPFAGVVTLSFATIGFYGKLLAEDIEDMDPSQAEAVRATGAGWLQWINYGVQPQVMPRMIGLGLYRFDINFRESAVVGIVGGRRHRCNAGHCVRSLRIRFRGRHPADHHRHRDAGGIFVRLHSPLGAVMAVALRHGTRVWHRRERGAQFATWLAWLVAAAIFIYCWELISDKTIWAFVTDAPAQAADLAVRMVPPDWRFIAKLWRPLWDTLNIATLGTAIAIVLAVPVAYCAARNTTPSVALVRPVALFIIVSSRSINSLIWALMLVTIIGPGVFAGILAIGLRSIGFCAKLLYEAIEEIDEKSGRGGARDWREWPAGHGVRHRAASTAGVCRHLGFPLGHQHSRVHGVGPRWRRRHRLAAQRRDHDARLDPGVAHSPDHHRNGRRQRMGFGQGAPRDYLRPKALGGA